LLLWSNLPMHAVIQQHRLQSNIPAQSCFSGPPLR
jgi:hypothetical protein